MRPRSRTARIVWTGAELAVTFGAVLLLLVVHQLWWTNEQAREGAGRTVQALERQWADGGAGPPSVTSPPVTSNGSRDENDGDGSGDAGQTPAPAPGDQKADGADGKRGGVPAPLPDEAYAVLTIPRLGLRVPVAEGIGRTRVLNKGYAGHYPGTAQPGEEGNVALAGHRNAHGEPFRHLDRLRSGDELRLETRSTRYVYRVDRVLAQTTPGDGGVIEPVPRSRVHPDRGYTRPGHYVTLTTCTPEFSSRFRLVVWGVLSSTRGK